MESVVADVSRSSKYPWMIFTRGSPEKRCCSRGNRFAPGSTRISSERAVYVSKVRENVSIPAPHLNDPFPQEGREVADHPPVVVLGFRKRIQLGTDIGKRG